MKTVDIILVILWTLITIEVIIISIQIFKGKQLNHLFTNNHTFEEVCFEITNIRYITHNFVEYTATVHFFKKPNAKHFVYDEYRFYDIKYKYNIGDKLYLNKRQ